MATCNCDKIGYATKRNAARHAKSVKGHIGKGVLRQYKCDQGVWHNTSSKPIVRVGRLLDFTAGSVWANADGYSFEVVVPPATRKGLHLFNDFSRIK